MLFPCLFLLFSVPAFVIGDNVIGLTENDFETQLKKYPLALVKFYAPWCGHCKALAPHYIKAADTLASSEYSILLAEVDCTTENNLCQKYKVSGYPTLKIFKNGDYDSEYKGRRSSDDIVNYLSRRAKPSSVEVKSIKEIEDRKHFDFPTIVAYFKNPSDSFKTDYMGLGSALLDNTLFMHTHDNIFGVDAERFLRLYIPKKLNSPLEVLSFDYDGQFSSDSVKEWIRDKGLGIFGHRTEGTEFFYSESDVLVIYHNISFNDDPAGIKYFRNRVIKSLKNADLTNLKAAYSYSNDYMGDVVDLSQNGELPVVVMLSRSGKKYKMDSFSFAGIEEFLKNYKAGKLTAHIKSEPIPEDDGEPVKTVVALNFDDVVNDPTKDVLVVFHAPWCGHCKNLMPKLTETAKKLKDEPGVLIAKIDATANEVSKPYEVSGFPTIYFVPKADKQNPKQYLGGRDVDDMVKYIAAHSTDELVGFDRSGSPKKTDL